ncbi:MAG: hypothetical protein HZA61_04075 [Candidatus Eisenbacteria bacterium]|uniref:Cohesin domain-containing protein n=1 Tax=Eiseniibacteriota bacterium TaxID=2212470 RepID=A0A933S9W3_UNCEI|nr:hypothetical protein [Candidatus Eisenbacteria bacterium]
MFRAQCAALCLVLAALTSCAAPGARAAVLSISPADTTVQVGATFTLRVTCDAVSDLKGMQTAWGYSATRLQLVSMTAGNVFTDGGGAWFEHMIFDVSAPADTAWLDVAKLNGTAQGPGVAAYVRFKALVPGDAPVQCTLAEMRDSDNVSLLPGCSGGIVHVAAPTAITRRSWGQLKIHAR